MADTGFGAETIIAKNFRSTSHCWTCVTIKLTLSKNMASCSESDFAILCDLQQLKGQLAREEKQDQHEVT